MQASMIAVTEYCIQQHFMPLKSVHKHKSTHCKLSAGIRSEVQQERALQPP